MLQCSAYNPSIDVLQWKFHKSFPFLPELFVWGPTSYRHRVFTIKSRNHEVICIHSSSINLQGLLFSDKHTEILPKACGYSAWCWLSNRNQQRIHPHYGSFSFSVEMFFFTPGLLPSSTLMAVPMLVPSKAASELLFREIASSLSSGKVEGMLASNRSKDFGIWIREIAAMWLCWRSWYLEPRADTLRPRGLAECAG